MKIRFETRTHKPFERFRSDLHKSMSRSFASHLMQFSWRDHTLNVRTPGAQGRVHFDNGRVHAELHMGFPATLFRDRIIRDVRRMCADASGAPVQAIE
ncbi:MAG TPA: polyhydroxyalkanoic acid system family protein [Vicinamibacterales bacterium]|nr:polyhydroxyalkanoic acid system family protein [Vicinamibacterales bacterium]